MHTFNQCRVTEQLKASTLIDNYRSQNLLINLGFKKDSAFEGKLALDNKIFLIYDMYDWVLYKDSFVKESNSTIGKN